MKTKSNSLSFTTLGAFRFAVLLSIAVIATLATACSDAGPRKIELSAQPGETVVIPFDRPVKGSKTKALSFIPASPLFNPRSLPQGAELIYSSLSLFGSGNVSGHLLVHVPQDAEGDIVFTVSASGSGSRAVGGSAASFSTDDVDVTINVSGDVMEQTQPDLDGEWRDGDRVWVFQQADISTLKIKHPTGEEDLFRHKVYAGTNGRWYLIGYGIDANAYWIEVDENENLRVSVAKTEFDPYYEFTRAP